MLSSWQSTESAGRRVKPTKHVRRINISGKRIRQARIMHQPPLAQYQLAAKLTAKSVVIDQGSICRIENQERGVSDYELVAIARCLKVSVSWLCGEKR